MDKDAAVYVAGGQTLLGSAILRRLREQGYRNVRGGATIEPDLHDASAVDAFFAAHRPEFVFHAAGRSGGIVANIKHPAELIYDNLLSGAHVIHAAHTHQVRKLIYLASSCSYPKAGRQPLCETELMTGPLEPTNEAYATAKLAGIKLCQAYRQQYGDDFIVGIPTNGFGIGDDFSPEDSHVIGALIRRIHEAKTGGRSSVMVWGTGRPRREFLWADDLADAAVFAMNHYSDAEPINLGGGTDLSIGELADRICRVVGFHGRLEFDASKPDGMPRKALDAGKLLGLGWRPQMPLDDALAATYQDFLSQVSDKK
jgi:GDP-L-fucose synthase